MSGRCGGLHCDGCGHGGPGGLVAFVVLVLIVAAAAGPVVRAVTDLLEIALMVAGGLLVTGGMVAVLVWRARRRRGQLGGRGRVVLTAVPVRPGLPGRADAPALPRGGVPTHSRIHAEPHVVTSRRAAPGRSCRRGRDAR